MPFRVVEIELSQPLPSFRPSEDGRGVFALLRWHGRPVGLLRHPARAGDLSPQALQAKLAGLVVIPDDSAPSTSGKVPVSVVVCTRDRPQDLHNCLEALRPHHQAGHQVIIVDNAPSTRAAAELASSYPYDYVCEPRPGLNRARSRGVSLARHEIVAFTDDDCLPDPGWLRALTTPYRDPQVGGATGLVLPLELETPAQERFEDYCANRRIFHQRSFSRQTTLPAAAGVVGMGANMSVRRALLEQIGGFDPRFDGGTVTLSGGDTEMFARLLAAGAKLVYCPDALVWHRHGRDPDRLRKVIFGYGAGLYAVLAKRLIEDQDWSVLTTAPRWLAGPPLKAAWNRLRRRPAADLQLVLAEFWGALHGPFRYLQARSQSAGPGFNRAEKEQLS